MSYKWRSVLKGLKLLKEGIIIVWRGGNGDNISIWNDNWIPREGSGKPMTTTRGQNLLHTVSALIDPIVGDWDIALVKQTFCDEDADLILKIPICEGVED